MSVIYRAVWEAEIAGAPGDAVDLLRRTFTAWALDDPKATPLDDGTTAHGPRTLVLAGVESGELRGLTCTAVDEPDVHGSVWRTVARVAVDDSVHFLVENHLESDSLTQYVSVGRPRIVTSLLGRAQRNLTGGSAILTEPQPFAADQVGLLLELLADERRTLPFIVFSEPSANRRVDWLRLAQLTADRATGVAMIATLDHGAVTAFRDALGDLAVWGGAARTYAPTPVHADSGGFAHRYISARQIENTPDLRIVDRLVLAVSQLSGRRRVPDVFAALEAPSPVLDLADDLAAARARSDDLELELMQAQDDAAESERELARSRGHLERLRLALLELNQIDTFYGTIHEIGDAIPDEVQSVSEAFLSAQLYLADDLAIPESAGRDHEPLDTAASASAWGNATWRGLRALAAYVQDRRAGFSGDFWAWCKEGRPNGWPATPKKLAMVESDSVRHNAKYRDARRLPVSADLDPGGEKYMEAHLKIAEGGGNLAPRVYFFDDTVGATAKVHIGLVGPHYLVPNSSS